MRLKIVSKITIGRISLLRKKGNLKTIISPIKLILTLHLWIARRVYLINYSFWLHWLSALLFCNPKPIIIGDHLFLNGHLNLIILKWNQSQNLTMSYKNSFRMSCHQWDSTRKWQWLIKISWAQVSNYVQFWYILR